ncbi:hypothetical protein HY468_00055 [Candidatus Roizmanbacteria bacterium]|nr:hypothetical protein [Candidatus Roizmanbacteria bacterium]
MPGQYKLDIENALSKRLDRLIAVGEKFYKEKSHPGRTQEFEDWREEINGMVDTVWGKNNHYFGSLSRVSIFPRWFDPKIHGPFQTGEVGRVITDAQAHDTDAAFAMYKQGVGKILALLKSMRNDVDDFGVPEKQGTKGKEYPIIDFRPNLTNSNNPSFENTNQQSQTQTSKIWIQDLSKTIDEKLKDKSLETHEKSFLERVKGGLTTVKTVGELVGLAMEAGAAVGLSASRAAQLLGVGN